MFKYKNCLVVGMAKSGVASARLLKSLGAEVTISDASDTLTELAETLRKDGFDVILGKNPEVLSGFDLIVISPGIPFDLPFLCEARELGIPVWGEIELAYSQCNSPLFAITGTNGKTTTTTLLGDVVRTAHPGTKTLGNIGEPFTEYVLSMKPETPAVLEISSFQLETIHCFKPHVAAILNITPDHLNRHKTMEEYIRVKARIFENQTADDFTVLNYDDEICRKLGEGAKGKVYYFSRLSRLDKGVYLDGEDIYAKVDGFEGKVMSLDLIPIIGDHNVENVLAAICMGLCFKLDPIEIKRAVSAFKAVSHRLEYVREKDGIVFYNDSKATNPDAAIKSIAAFKRPIVLIGGGYDKGVEFDDWVKLFMGRVKKLVVMGQVADKIIETCDAHGFQSYEKVNSLREAVDLAYEIAESGDCVLLAPACASWDMFDNYEQRGDMFKDFVRAL